MIKCKLEGGCPKNKVICCECCDEKCEYICNSTPNKCSDADFGESTSLEIFENKAKIIINAIEEICVAKKKLEQQEKEMREKLEKAMSECGIKSFENDVLKITYSEPTTRESFDATKFKTQYPDIAKNFIKVSAVKGSIKITLKSGG